MANAKEKETLKDVEGLVTPEPEAGVDAGASDETNNQAKITAEKPEDKQGKKPTAKPEDGAKEATEKEAPSPKKDERVDYVLPRYILSNDKYVTVTHNGVNYQIETGKSVKVPKGVKEILEDAVARKMQAQGEEEKLVEEAMKL